jgi:hypothetical protein
MTLQKLIWAIPGLMTAALMIVCLGYERVRDRRGRTLFMRETGGSRQEFDALPPSAQKKWIERDAEERELNKFVRDFNARRRSDEC